MKKATILHLTDLHWSKSQAANIKIVSGALVKDLELLKNEQSLKIDLIIFSGDLVQSGETLGDLQSAFDEFIVPVLDATGLDRTKLFFVPGNHDIARQIVRDYDYIEVGLKAKFTSVDLLNSFIDQNAASPIGTSPVFARMDNYDTFLKSACSSAPVFDSRFLQVHKAKIGELDVGIACFNTAWRATGEADSVDRKNILLGERNVDIAVDQLKDTELKLAVLHHPLDWFKEFDEEAVGSRLYSEFDIVFCGHIHRAIPEARFSPIGNALFSQSGCIFQNRDYFNGYQILDVDLDASKVDFTIRTYQNMPRRSFDKAVNVAPEGKVSFDLKKKP